MVFYRSFTDSISYPLDGNRAYWFSLKRGLACVAKFTRADGYSSIEVCKTLPVEQIRKEEGARRMVPHDASVGGVMSALMFVRETLDVAADTAASTHTVMS